MKLCWPDVLAVVGVVVGVALLTYSVAALVAWQARVDLVCEYLGRELSEGVGPTAGWTCEIRLPDGCTLEDGVLTIVLNTSTLEEEREND